MCGVASCSLNGRIVTNKRPRGRPPKHPRPELVVDEVPLPPYLAARRLRSGPARSRPAGRPGHPPPDSTR